MPNGTAKALASSRSGILGLLFHDLDPGGDAADVDDSPLYLDRVLRGAESAATAAGNALLIAATRGRTGRDLAYSIAGKVDGLVVFAQSLPTSDQAALARTVPIVTVGGSKGTDDVSVDNRTGMRELVRHLLQVHGLRRFVFIGGPPRSPDAMSRFAGYRDALREAGLPVTAKPDAGGSFTESGGESAAERLLASPAGEAAQAIVCANDEMAIGARNVLAGRGIRIGTDVAVTGFDNIAAARHTSPPLTTVNQPMRRVGREAVELLLRRLREPQNPPHRVQLPTDPVIRRSCGCGGPDERNAEEKEDR